MNYIRKEKKNGEIPCNNCLQWVNVDCYQNEMQEI